MKFARTGPTVYRKTNPKTMYGCCCECGKRIAIRNSDGMIRKHGDKNATQPGCVGSLKKPSKAAESEYKTDWVPPRRSN